MNCWRRWLRQWMRLLAPGCARSRCANRPCPRRVGWSMWCSPSLGQGSRIWNPGFGLLKSAEPKGGHLETLWTAPSLRRGRRCPSRPLRSSAGPSGRGPSRRRCLPCRQRRAALRACGRCTLGRGRGSPDRLSPRRRPGRCGGRIGCARFQVPRRGRCASRRPASFQATPRSHLGRSPAKPCPTLLSRSIRATR